MEQSERLDRIIEIVLGVLVVTLGIIIIATMFYFK